MSTSPGSPASPSRPEAEDDEVSQAIATEITPIFSSPSELSRSYQTTRLPTHPEARNEEDTEDDDEEGQAGPQNGAHEAFTSSAAPRQASLKSNRSLTHPRKGRLTNSMRRASDRSSLRGRRQGSSSGAVRGGEESEEGSEGEGRAGPRRRRLRKWWRRAVDKYGSVELDNKGSVARDHLALERTFLAWLRTSLSFASIGIAITQLFRLNATISDREGLVPAPEQDEVLRLRQMGKPLGATFLGISIVVLLVGSRRYFESQYWIVRGKFPASRGSVVLVTLVAIALIIVSLAVTLVVSPTQFET
jgi:uncharacterized membrane protein YidH (DUF202 family)